MKAKKDLTAKQRLTIAIKKSKPWPWQLYVSICIIIFCAIVFCGKLQSVHGADAPQELNNETVQVRLTVGGDVQISNHVRKLANNIGYDQLFAGLSAYWSQSDCVMVNVSGPVLRTDVENYKSTREKDEISNYVRPAAVRGFAAAGIDMLSFANDDAYNYGTTGINTTIEIMNENNMDYIGVEANANLPLYRTLTYSVRSPLGLENQKQVSIISVNDDVRDKSTVSTTKAGIVNSSINTLYTTVYEISQQSEYTVAYVHFDEEESHKVTNDQRTIAQAMIDAGADLVVGSHSVLQTVEEYHGGLIVYGLGTLVSDESASTSLDGALLDLIIDEEGLAKVFLTPTRMWNGQPEVVENKFYLNRIHTILTKGLSDDSYSISDTGVICISLD